MYVYEMGFPIDFFGFMRPVKEMYQRLLECEVTRIEDEYLLPMSPSELRGLLRRSLRALARMKTYWEGDVRHGELYIGSLPGDDDHNDSYHFIALKQDNNGSSYVISQVELVHLHHRFCHMELGSPVSQQIQDGIEYILQQYTPIPVENKDDCIVF